MIGLLKKKLKNENGAVQIVEASFVFPIMFIILFFLIYMGNAHYIKSQIEGIVVRNAIKGANYCVDPVLQSIRTTGKIPEVGDVNLDPYRYFSGMNGVEKQIEKDILEEIEASSVSFFTNMKPDITRRSDIAKYNNYILYSTFSVDVKYEIKFPIRFLGKSSPNILDITAHSEVAVNDTPEFIRNVDMVLDYFADSKLGQTVKGVFDKINDFLDSFAKSGG